VYVTVVNGDRLLFVQCYLLTVGLQLVEILSSACFHP